MLWQYPAVSRQLFLVSLAFPAYYVVLSLVLHFRLARPERLSVKPIAIHAFNPGPFTGAGNWTWLIRGRVTTLIDAGTGDPQHLEALDARARRRRARAGARDARPRRSRIGRDGARRDGFRASAF